MVSIRGGLHDEAGFTVFHECTLLGEALGLLKEVCKHYPYGDDQDGRVQDKKGDNPYHIVMDRKKSPITVSICEILSQFPINPNIPNEQGKKPRADKQDKRYAFIQQAAKRFPKKKSGKKKKGKSSEAFHAISYNKNSVAEDLTISPKQDQESLKSPTDDMLDTDSVSRDIKEMLTELSDKPQSYFEPLAPNKKANLPHATHEKSEAAVKKETTEEVASNGETAVTLPCKPPLPTHDQVAVDIDNLDHNFEGCPWEVECTEKVKKYFSNAKVPRTEKEAVVKTIKYLTDGIPINNHNLCKELRSSSSGKLYESRFSKGSRIIYELAIQFSPRLTRKGNYIYSEVIRLWDIVRDHDNLNRHIERALLCIKKSQERGEMAAITIPLKTSQKPKQSTQGQEQIRLPQVYICGESEANVEALNQSFHPAGSIKDDEYNVITFYSFDDSFVKSMLNGDNVRRDFPFKEWPKEHDIINMP